MKQLALIALCTMMANLSSVDVNFAETQALANQGNADAQHLLGLIDYKCISPEAFESASF